MENKNPCQVKACFQKILASDSLNRNDAAMFQNYLLRFLDPKLEKEFRSFLRDHVAIFVRIGAISAVIGYIAVFILFMISFSLGIIGFFGSWKEV